MYSLRVQLPSVVRVASTGQEPISSKHPDTTIYDDDEVGQLPENKDSGIHEKELLLNSQLLVAKQKEMREMKQLQQLVEKILFEFENFSEQQLNYLHQVNTGVTTLAMAIANKIIFSKTETDASFIAKIVENALKTTNNEQYFVIQINPEDKVNLEKYWNHLLENNNQLSKMAIEENVSIKRGGCIIKTPNGTIVAQIEKQLSLIEDALMLKYSGLVYEQS